MSNFPLVGRAVNALQSRRYQRNLSRAISEGKDRYTDIDGLAEWHFTKWAKPDHINRTGLTLALRLLQQKPAVILETGTSAWGCDSSRLWAAYVDLFGGEFWSVDIRPEASEPLLGLSTRAHFAVGDSIQFIENFSNLSNTSTVNFAYLDSYDLDVRDPWPAMEHGLKEWRALVPLLESGSVVVIDDTPVEAYLVGSEASDFRKMNGFVPGKGALVLREPELHDNFDIVYHHYNLVLQMR